MSGVIWHALHGNAGVQGTYWPGSNIVECAVDVIRLLGHIMPPVGEV
jgi:methylmalonyl-CoA mutase